MYFLGDDLLDCELRYIFRTKGRLSELTYYEYAVEVGGRFVEEGGVDYNC